MKQQMPIKVYICRECDYKTPHRWVLVRHMVNVHEYSEKKARIIAMGSEYMLNPYHSQEQAWSIRSESKGKEAKMKKVRTLQDILDKLEEANISPQSVVVNPREISVIADSDDDDDSENEPDEK